MLVIGDAAAVGDALVVMPSEVMVKLVAAGVSGWVSNRRRQWRGMTNSLSELDKNHRCDAPVDGRPAGKPLRSGRRAMGCWNSGSGELEFPAAAAPETWRPVPCAEDC